MLTNCMIWLGTSLSGFVWQLGDEDCILPSKLQAALQQILEEREDMLRQEDGEQSGG